MTFNDPFHLGRSPPPIELVLRVKIILDRRAVQFSGIVIGWNEHRIGNIHEVEDIRGIFAGCERFNRDRVWTACTDNLRSTHSA